MPVEVRRIRSARSGLLAAAAVMLTGVVAGAATGGPDTFGYAWRDTASGATFSWYDATATGGSVVLTDDSNTGFIALPFAFTYYGTAYNQIAACSNGWASFVDDTTTSYSNVAIPTAAVPNGLLPAFWDDLYGATLYYDTFGTAPNRVFVIEWFEFPDCCSGTNPLNTFEIVLYEGSGVIKYQYLSLNGDLLSSTVGIENDAGDDGLQCLYNGTGTNGFALADNYAVEFFLPSGSLDCTGATSISCDTTVTSQSMGSTNNATDYACSGLTYDGRERVYQLDLASEQNLDIVISNFGNDQLDVFFLSACNEATACLAGGGDAISQDNVPPGTYYIVVDGERTNDTGPFDLDVQCNPPSTLSCGVSCDTTLLSENFEGAWPPGGWTAYDNIGSGNLWQRNDAVGATNRTTGTGFSAAADDEFTGGDWDSELWSPPISLAGMSSATLTYKSNFQDFAGSGQAWLDVTVNAGASWTNLTYWTDDWGPTDEAVSLDAYVGQTIQLRWRYTDDNYDLAWYWHIDDVEVCGQSTGGYSCAGAQVETCPFSGTDTTVGGTSQFDGYSCSNDTWAGSEKIYEFTFTGPTAIDVTLSNFGGRDMGVFLLSGCDPCLCVAGGGTTISETVSAGTYYLVVDGFTSGDDGSFDLDVSCVDPCQTPPPIACGATVASDTTGAGNDLDDPGLTCVGGGPGPDEIHRFDYAGPVGSTIWAEAVPGGGWDHILYALSDCTDVGSCLAGADSGPITFTTTSSPQTVFFVVDGYFDYSEGPYDLTVQCFSNQLSCAGATPLSCYDTVAVDTTGGAQDVYTYGCAGSGPQAGPERVYEITTTSVGDLTATLTGITGDDLDVFILDASCGAATCLAWGESTATVTSAPAGTYYVVIDTDRFDGGGAATLQVTCQLANGLPCGSAVPLSCNSELDADTSAGTDAQDRYSCDVRDLAGREVLYELNLAAPRYVRASLSNLGGRDLDLVLMSSCDPNACVAHADTELLQLVGPGTYYLAVDGVTNLDDGPYHLEVLCIEPSALSCASACDPGYEEIMPQEGFEGVWDGATPPAGWTIIDNGSAGDGWNDNDWHQYYYSTRASNVARVYYLPIETQDEELVTPTLDCSAYTSVVLKYWHYYSDFSATDFGYVDLSTNGGSTFPTNIVTYDTDIFGADESFDISAQAAGDNNVAVRWRYEGNDDLYWYVDDAVVCGSPASGSGGLDCSAPTPIACGDTLTGQSMGAANNERQYACSSLTYDGAEHVYELTLATVQTVTVTLSNYADEDLAVFLLSACDSCSCLQGGGTTLTATGLNPGTYYIVVEGYDASDDDATYDITVGCSDPCLGIPVLTCNTPVSGDTSDDTNQMDPSCGAGAGPEELWKLFFTGPVGSNLVVSMPDPGFDHTLYALGNCLDPASCSAWADSGSINLTTTTSPQTFYIAVDGYGSGASGAYSDLLVTCPIPNNLDCAGAIPLSCGTTAVGNTVGQSNDADEYAGVNGFFTGGEDIYEITLATTQNIDLYLENHPGRRMYLFLLDACNVNNVIDGGVGEIHEDGVAPGTYYVVVDGRTPADNGGYDLRFVCNDPATPPSCATTCTDTIFVEDFSAGLPASWLVTDGGDSADTWFLDNASDPSGCLNTDPLAPLADNWMAVDSDCAGSGFTLVETLETNFNIDCTVGGPYSEIHLTFDHWFNSIGGDLAEVQVQSSATAGWVTVASYTTDSTNPESVDIDITAQALGQTDLRIRFVYDDGGTYAWYWYVDNVQVCGVDAGAGGLDCSSAPPIACDSTVNGDTSAPGLTNAENAYTCGVDTYDGNEEIYELTIVAPTMVQFDLSNFGSRELDVFVLSGCDPCDCIAGGSDSFSVALDPGTYYVVVDGFTAADDGSYDLTLTCTSCTDAGAHQRWSVCENPRSPITTATTSAFEWFFDDCDYCRDSGNSCFTTACTFDMYIVAECGTEMHMPLYDNETGNLQIYDMLQNQYVYLYAASTGGWTAEGYNISWQDCGGLDPNWNDQTTDIWFYGTPTLCGIYRAEFVDWGGFIWDLYSNCTGSSSPGFRIYDNYCEALAAYDPKPSLSVESLTITGSCPNYTVDYEISNAGCAPASTTVFVESDLGGSAEQDEADIQPGETRLGSITLNVQNGGNGTITAWADFYDTTLECQEAGSTVVACSVSGGTASVTEPVTCSCVIPQFSNAQVEDLACPVGIRAYWPAATFDSGSGHYDVYRSTVSFADAVANAPIATNIVATEYVDNATTPGTTYFYVIRAEDDQPAVSPCAPGPHGGAYTDVNAGPITDNLSQSQDKPYDIGNDLHASKVTSTEVAFDWTGVTPDPNTTHWHVYRSSDPSLTFPDNWSMICPDKPAAGWLPPATTGWNDTSALAAEYYYDVRSANDCEDISPKNIYVAFGSNSPSCDASGQIDFASVVQGGVAPYTYQWDFGDGSPLSSLANPSHTYTFPPYSRNVTLTVTDSTTPAPQVGVSQQRVFFGSPVTADFTWGAAGLTVTFDGVPGGGSGSYTFEWDFGDGNGATVEDPVHTYANPGTYTVTLVVTDAQSACKATSAQDVTP